MMILQVPEVVSFALSKSYEQANYMFNMEKELCLENRILAPTGKVDKDPLFLGKSIDDLALYVNGKAASASGGSSF
jgi:hypothetical protein